MERVQGTSRNPVVVWYRDTLTVSGGTEINRFGEEYLIYRHFQGCEYIVVDTTARVINTRCFRTRFTPLFAPERCSRHFTIILCRQQLRRVPYALLSFFLYNELPA